MEESKIIIGRLEKDIEKFGNALSGFFGFSEDPDYEIIDKKFYLDLINPHRILICGKTGMGKSYTMGVFIEELSNLPKQYRERLSVVIIDPLGVFNTMIRPSKDKNLNLFLKKLGLMPKGFDLKIFVPKNYSKFYSEEKMNESSNYITFKPGELNITDWCLTLGIERTEPMGILLERHIDKLQQKFSEDFEIDDLIESIVNDMRAHSNTKEALENRLIGAKKWQIFESTETSILELIKGGQISLIDLELIESGGDSAWGVRSLVVALIMRKIFEKRLYANRFEQKFLEEDKDIDLTEIPYQFPLVWLFIDEAHNFLPRGRNTACSALIKKWIKEGRKPGLSIVMATQRPGALHPDGISQCDIVISHRITMSEDIDALKRINSTYMKSTISAYLHELDKNPGSAIVIDDQQEKIHTCKIRPRQSYHGGSAAKLIDFIKEPIISEEDDIL
ncbi:MAG: ATP-binding protein [Candidatus Helarchaeota archaeon]